MGVRAEMCAEVRMEVCMDVWAGCAWRCEWKCRRGAHGGVNGCVGGDAHGGAPARLSDGLEALAFGHVHHEEPRRDPERGRRRHQRREQRVGVLRVGWCEECPAGGVGPVGILRVSAVGCGGARSGLRMGCGGMRFDEQLNAL